MGLDCRPRENVKMGMFSEGRMGTDPTPETAVQNFVSSMQPPDFPDGRYVELSDDERFPLDEVGWGWNQVLVHSVDGRIDAAVMVAGSDESGWGVVRFQVCK